MSDVMAAGLAQWEGFPIDREPRPMVLIHGDPQWKRGVSARLRESGVLDGPALPETVLTPEQLEYARWYCRDVHTGASRPLARIVDASMPFWTDRGEQRLPARIMLPDGRADAFVALDPEVEQRMTWKAPGMRGPSSGYASDLAQDGVTLTYRIGGPIPSVAVYHVRTVLETATAVCIGVDQEWLAGPDAVYPSVQRVHELTVRLPAPLGNRVLIRTWGNLPEPQTEPIAVILT